MHLHSEPTATSAGRLTAPAATFKRRSALEEEKLSPDPPEPLPPPRPKRDKPLPRSVTGNHWLRDSMTTEGPPKPAPHPKPRPRDGGGGSGLVSPRKPGAALEAWPAFLLPVRGLWGSAGEAATDQRYGAHPRFKASRFRQQQRTLGQPLRAAGGGGGSGRYPVAPQ